MANVIDIDQAGRDLDRLNQCLDLTRPGIEGSLGRDLLANQAARIYARAAHDPGEAGTDGDWAANRGSYAEKKAKLGLPVGKGIAQDGPDRMLALQNLKGPSEVSASSATMTCGWTTAAQDKSAWFTNGSTGSDGERSGAKNQQPRPFYGFTESDADALVKDAMEAIEKFIDTEW